jgi:tetratricopeptide (TPR) repeat protein
MRRGKSYESLGDNEKAKADLDKALLLEPQNGEAKVISKRVQEKIDSVQLELFNKTATDYQR